MKNIHIAYGHSGMTAQIPESNLLGIYESALPPAAADGYAEVVRAMDNPIDSPPLELLARGCRPLPR